MTKGEIAIKINTLFLLSSRFLFPPSTGSTFHMLWGYKQTIATDFRLSDRKSVTDPNACPPEIALKALPPLMSTICTCVVYLARDRTMSKLNPELLTTSIEAVSANP